MGWFINDVVNFDIFMSTFVCTMTRNITCLEEANFSPRIVFITFNWMFQTYSLWASLDNMVVPKPQKGPIIRCPCPSQNLPNHQSARPLVSPSEGVKTCQIVTFVVSLVCIQIHLKIIKCMCILHVHKFIIPAERQGAWPPGPQRALLLDPPGTLRQAPGPHADRGALNPAPKAPFGRST